MDGTLSIADAAVKDVDRKGFVRFQWLRLSDPPNLTVEPYGEFGSRL